MTGDNKSFENHLAQVAGRYRQIRAPQQLRPALAAQARLDEHSRRWRWPAPVLAGAALLALVAVLRPFSHTVTEVAPRGAAPTLVTLNVSALKPGGFQAPGLAGLKYLPALPAAPQIPPPPAT